MLDFRQGIPHLVSITSKGKIDAVIITPPIEYSDQEYQARGCGVEASKG
jgi:hypothetical protein